MTPSFALPNFRAYHTLMSLVFLVTLVAGWSMLPGEEERIAMLERDGHSRHALEILEAAYGAGDRSYRTLHHMLGLYEDQGNADKAREMLEAMVVARPRDAMLRTKLSKFYRDNGHNAELLAALRAQVDVRYSEGACRELISALRLAGRADEEADAIRFCRQKGYRRADDLVRLAGFEAAEGDALAGSSLLRSIDDVRRLRDADDRFELVALLLDLDQPRDAVRRVLRWINASRDQTLAVGLIDQLARSRYPDAALEVAKEAGRAGDSISLTVAERLIEQAQPQVAQLYLRGWLDNAQFEDEEVVVRFIDAAIEVRDPTLALSGARKYGFARLPAAAGATLHGALQQAGLSKEADEVRAALPVPAASEAQPREGGGGLTAAGSGDAGRAVGVALPTQVQLSTIGEKEALDVWRRTLWARLSEDARRKAPSLGLTLPRRSAYEGEESRGHEHTKVLKKTTKVLQRTKKLRSLKLKQKLVHEPPGAKPKKP